MSNSLRSFLGHVGFYRRFIKDFSKIARPMTQLLMKDAKFDFLDECIKSFDILRDKLIIAPVIIAANWDLDFELMCDASDYAVGAVLGQRIEKKFRLIYYTSKTMNNAQEHYATTEKELLAVVYAFDKFRTKHWHDSKIMDKEFQEGEEVLVFNSRLKLFPGKLRTRWYGPYTVSKVYSYGTVEVLGSGYHQKDRKPSQNDKTEHGMEKTVQNQGQSPKMSKSESIQKNQQSNRSQN
ncbi:reverse transcriptase domain-containing protein [Tanacetum coccineum]